ncbi:MAG: HNH endonuclease [Thermoleophilaceae bacterium]|nr:HNH endonuclease [Thermoleophilaceae bacterium]
MRLGISKPTVSYHARRLGRPVKHACARRYDWTEIQAAYDSGLSVAKCQERFGFSNAAWNGAVKRGAVIPRPQATPIDDLLVAGRARGRGHIKSRLIRSGLKQARCEGCGLEEWRGKPLGLELHHRNGDNDDNRLGNLEILCPNCHAQTDNWGGRGRRVKAA